MVINQMVINQMVSVWLWMILKIERDKKHAFHNKIRNIVCHVQGLPFQTSLWLIRRSPFFG